MADRTEELDEVLSPEQRVDLLALVWFYSANARLRRALKRGMTSDAARYWLTELGITDPAVLEAFWDMYNDNKAPFESVASAVALRVCPIACWIFVTPGAMKTILAEMRTAIPKFSQEVPPKSQA